LPFRRFGRVLIGAQMLGSLFLGVAQASAPSPRWSSACSQEQRSISCAARPAGSRRSRE
jgi:hypothetical protein